jgi:hypothetical protein
MLFMHSLLLAFLAIFSVMQIGFAAPIAEEHVGTLEKRKTGDVRTEFLTLDPLLIDTICYRARTTTSGWVPVNGFIPPQQLDESWLTLPSNI